MSKGIKPPKTFHGKAGKSGRKTIYEEWNKVNVINKLWEKVNKKVMAGEELTEYEEKLVLSILPKTIQTNVKLETPKALEVNHNINLQDIKRAVSEVEERITSELYAKNTAEISTKDEE